MQVGSTGRLPPTGGTYHTSFSSILLTSTELSARIARFSRNDFTGNSAARVSLAWDSGSSVIWAPRRNRGIRASRYRADLLGGSRNVEHVQQRADYPTHWRKAVGAW